MHDHRWVYSFIPINELLFIIIINKFYMLNDRAGKSNSKTNMTKKYERNLKFIQNDNSL